MLALDNLGESWRRLVFVAVVAISIGLGVGIYETLPPRTVVMATGSEGGAYYELAIRYRDILAKSGVKLQLRPTSGGLENLALLNAPRSGVHIAFVQGGTTTRDKSPGLESLGTVFYEPLWLFVRADIGDTLQSLKGRSVSIGPEGSAGRALALDLVKRTRLDGIAGALLDLPPSESADKLIAGEIDAAFMVSGWPSPVVQRLINTDGIEPRSFQRAEALVALYPFLTRLTLPAGVINLAANRPPSDVILLAPKASLVVRSNLHPAIQHLLLNAAEQIHSGPGIFQRAGQFPAAESIDLPLSEEAQRYYKSGRPFLEQHLPFWLAALVERLLFVLLPIIVVVYPLLRFLPQMVDWYMQSKIRRLYDEMRAIERDVNAPDGDSTSLALQLDAIEERANMLRLPSNYASMLYTLRSHVNLVRARMAAKQASDGH